MNPTPKEAAAFIEELLARGWRVQGQVIHSDQSVLHFPYPDGWSDSLDNLEEIMQCRLARFKDRGSKETQHLEDRRRELLIRVHMEAIRAIIDTRARM